jgi:predicted HicB family RNase H-like nuclease
MKDVFINMKTTSELKNKAVELAKKDKRTLSNWIEKLIEKEIEATR